jgi:hypothetical protein
LSIPEIRRTTLAGIAIVAAIAVSVVLIRAVTPYYMSFVVLTLLLGLAAFGLRAATVTPGWRYPAYAVIAGAAVVPVALAIGAVDRVAERLPSRSTTRA